MFKVINLGRMNYIDALKIQFKYQNKLIDSVQNKKNVDNYMIVVEHETSFIQLAYVQKVTRLRLRNICVH